MKRQPLSHEAVFQDKVFAERYAQHHQSMSEKIGSKIAAKLENRGIQTGVVLDAGCGAGGTCITLAMTLPGLDLVGIDLSQPLLEIAREQAIQAGLTGRVYFEEGDVTQIPFDDQSFDIVLSVNMLHLIDQPRLMLDEIERVTAVDGYICIADLKRSWLGLLEAEIKSAYTVEEARSILAESTIRGGRFSPDLLWWWFET